MRGPNRKEILGIVASREFLVKLFACPPPQKKSWSSLRLFKAPTVPKRPTSRRTEAKEFSRQLAGSSAPCRPFSILCGKGGSGSEEARDSGSG